MRVSAQQPTSPSTQRRGKKNVQEGIFAVKGGQSVSSASIKPAEATSSLAALIALQGEVPNNREEALQWSESTLDLLQQLQYDLLHERDEIASLQALQKTLEAQNITSFDPALSAIQAQILLRVRVELAKLGTP